MDWPALALFVFATSITPGPNNMMLMASGARFGLRRTVWHWFGVSAGLGAMILAFGAGLSRAVEAAPSLQTALKIASVVYMLWLAWRVAHASRPGEGSGAGRPMTFLQAAAFQWANPKVWAMALTTVSVYSGRETLAEVAVAALIASAVNFPCVGVWVIAGRPLRAFAAQGSRFVVVNRALALLILVSLAPMLREG